MAARQQVCFICLGSFKNPKLISCHHSFCYKCLEDYVRINVRNHRFDCPMCKTNVELPNGGVKDFQTNVHLDTNSGDLGTLDSVMKGNIRQRILCDQHQELEIKLFCRDCNVLICVVCKAVNHQIHATKTVVDAAAEVKQILQTKMSVCSDKMRRILTSKEKGEELDRCIDDAEREDLKAVEDQRSQLNQVLDEEVAKVNVKTKTVYYKRRLQNAAFKRDMENEIKTCSNAYENAKMLTGQGTDIEIIKKGPDLLQLISEAMSASERSPDTNLQKKLFSPAIIKKTELISMIGIIQDSTDSHTETEASSPVVEKENECPSKGTKIQDKVIATETNPPPPIVNEEVLDAVDMNVENVDSSDVSIAVENEKNEKLKLKYKYKEDQWSPINHEGKKQYDRDFLLQLQNAPESMSKPLHLPDIPYIIIEKPTLRPAKRDFAEGSIFVDFTPRYVWSGGPNRSGGVQRRSSGQRGRGGPGGSASQAKHINLSIENDIEVHHDKDACKIGHRTEKIDQDEVDLKSEELFKKVQSILNNLTPQKFQTLVAKMQALEIDTEARLKSVIDLVFEKAISEPGFSVAYANMCRCLSMFKVPAERKQGDVNFRALLLTRCQRESEKANSSAKEFDSKRKEIEKATTEEQKQQMKKELEDEETKAKRRTLGNIRFIGELFKLKMLTEKIMHSCVFKLLRSKDEENLECLCILLKTIGKELDTDKGKPRMDQYFAQMQKIVSEKKLSSRVRYMLQDVIELRLDKWVPRREDNNPETIDQIDRKVVQEAQDRAMFVQTLPQPKLQKGSRGRPEQPSGPTDGGADGWNTVSPDPLRINRTIDPTKLKLSKQFVPQFGYDLNKQAYAAPRMPVGGNPTQAAMYQATGVRQQQYFNQSSMRPSGYQISQPQPSQGLYTQQQLMFMPPPQYSSTAQVIMPMAATNYPQRMSSPAYQNSMPTTQGLFQLPQENTANFTPHAHTHTYNNPPVVFYNAAQLQNRPPAASGMSGQGQPPAKKRERTVLHIIDPNSGKDIMQEVQQARGTPPSSGTLGSHGTVSGQEISDTPQNEIAAQFAAQVAQVALSTHTGGNQQRTPSDAAQFSAQVSQVALSTHPVGNQQRTPSDAAQFSAQVSQVALSTHPVGNQQSRPSDAAQFSAPVALTTHTGGNQPRAPSDAAQFSAPVSQVALSTHPVGNQQRTPSYAAQFAVQVVLTTHTGGNQPRAPSDATQFSAQVALSTHPGINQQKTQSDATQFAAQVAISTDPGGNMQRTLSNAEDVKKDDRGKKKAKDINRKGETKQGSEMDAFMDLPTEIEASSPVVEKENEDPTEGTKIQDTVIATETNPPQPIVTEEAVDTVDINIQNVDSSDMSIAVENEKNEQLKLECKEDQFSVINDEDKKQYDGDVLPQLQNALETTLKPLVLPDIPDIIIKKPTETEVSSPLLEKGNKDASEGTKNQDKVIATETNTPPPIVNEEVVDTVEINIENVDSIDMSIAVENEKNEKLKLKYKYKEDQFSPINHEGKKQYDRDFHLQLQNAPESTLKPLDLPDIPDIIIERPTLRPANRDFAEGSSFVDFTPRYVWSGGPNRSGGVPRRSSGQRGRGDPGGSATQTKHINLSIEKDIELHHEIGTCKPGHRTEKIDQDEVDLKSEPTLRHADRNIAEGSSFVDFTPRYVWSGGPNRSGGVPRRSSNQRGRVGPGGSATQTKHNNLSIEKDIELNHAKEARKPGHRAEKIDQDEMDLKSERPFEERSCGREPERAKTVEKPSTPVQEFTDDQMLCKTRAIMDEYLHIQDVVVLILLGDISQKGIK